MDDLQEFREPETKSRRAVIITVGAFIFVIVLAIVTASLLKTYCTVSFNIDGSSMLPTFDGGVTKVADDGDKVILWKNPKLSRGNIVVFKTPAEENPLVKRVIGIAGDVIRIDKGNVYLNDKLLDEPYILEPMSPSSWLNNGQRIEVKDGEIYVMGDNRNDSSDSRSFGVVKTSNVIGKVIVIIKIDGGITFPKKK
ncbi:MAG: signal peptidase I [Clostridiaceae bacterium]|jgi:signal peptidase I|nr:signal peptidase I [Clostridiaceae bacterium]